MSSNTKAAPADPIQLGSHDEFETVVTDYAVVLIDFYADWCGPCQMMEPTIESLAEETDAAVLKVDVDRFQALAGEHDVQGIPTLLVFADGELAERMVGAQTADALSETLAAYTE